MQVIRQFIDKHREAYQVEPIRKGLHTALSGYRCYAAQQRNPAWLCVRAKRDALLMLEIHWIWEANMMVYRADKVWRQLHREQQTVACCTVERLIRHLGIHGGSTRKDGSRHPT